MKVKKLLATILTIAMACAPMTAMADEIIIEGDSTIVDTTQYVVTLPTSSSLNFNLDPTGAYGYFSTNPTATSVAEGSALDAYRGKIVGTGYDTIANKSSVDVVVTCDYKVISTAEKLDVVTGGDALSVTGNDLRLKIVGGSLAGSVYTPDVATATNIGETSTKVLVGLQAVDYQFVSGNDGITFEQVTASDSNEAYVSIAGDISEKGDWSELDGSGASKVKLSCVYSFKGVVDVTSGTTITKGIITAGATGLEYLAEEAGSGEAVEVYATWAPGAGGDASLWIGLNENSEDGTFPTGKTVENFKVNGTAISGAAIDANGWIELTWSTMLEPSGVSSPYTITFTVDGTNYTVTIS